MFNVQLVLRDDDANRPLHVFVQDVENEEDIAPILEGMIRTASVLRNKRYLFHRVSMKHKVIQFIPVECDA